MSDSAPLPVSPEGPRPGPDLRAGRAEYARGVRYGISLTAVLLGVFLVMQWFPAQLLNDIDPMWKLQILTQLGIAVLVLAGGLAVAPNSVVRALLAAVLAIALVLGATALYTARMTGTLNAGPPWIWMFLTPGTAALVAGLFGWLIVRRRPVLTYVLVLGALLPGIVRYGLLLNGVGSAEIWFSDLLLSLGVGVVAAWIAAAIGALFRPKPAAQR